MTPQLNSITPMKGPLGTHVTITGVSLTQTSAVSFDGVAAEFIVYSDLEVTATVPLGAITGSIAITTTGGSAASKAHFHGDRMTALAVTADEPVSVVNDERRKECRFIGRADLSLLRPKN
jgi:hypothetical protein